MTIIIENIVSTCVIGGKDHLKGDVYAALREHMRVKPKNYHRIMMQMKKRGNAYAWDGYTYFINKKCQFATGFIFSILTVAENLGLTVKIEDRRVNVPEFVEGDWDWSMPEGFGLARHQKKLIASLSNYIPVNDTEIFFPRGIWKAATNSRKTAAAGSLIKQVKNPHAIMLVDSLALLIQHYDFYKKMFPGKGTVGFITSGKQRYGSILTIAMVKTLYNRLKKNVTLQRDLWNRFNILIVDECHGFTGKEAVYAMNKINAGLRLLMSGTPLDGSDKVASLRLVASSGNVLHSITKRYLMDHGFSMIPNVEIYLNPSESNALTYDGEMADVLLESVEFAELVADLIYKNRRSKVMITFFEHRHGKLMLDTFRRRYPKWASEAAMVHGEDKYRTEKIEAYINNDITILFASTILQQGINISDMEVGINCIGEKSAITLSQFIGRMERLDGINTHFTWIDFWHSGKYMAKHSRKRLQLYRKEDYPTPIKYMYENRRGTPTTK